MATKDYIVIFISASALTLSLISLIVTLVQKSKETKRTIRKTLSNTLESISKINIETTKLKSSKEIDSNSEAIIAIFLQVHMPQSATKRKRNTFGKRQLINQFHYQLDI